MQNMGLSCNILKIINVGMELLVVIVVVVV